MLLGEMKCTVYFYTKNGKLYIPNATALMADKAYRERFGIEWINDKAFLMYITIMPNWDFNWCMAE